MAHKKALLNFTQKGIYCEKANIFIDAWRPVKRSIITHGHADHAHYGHKCYMAHESTTAIMSKRLGKHNYMSFQYGDSLSIHGVKFTFFPAGHLLGSCQIKVEYKGEVWVVTGDYKLQNDGICTPWEPIKCEHLITECTFGLPIYQWKPQEKIKTEINNWIKANSQNGFNSVLIGYSLGKAQRLLGMLETDLPIFCHGAVRNMTDIYRAHGKQLPPTIYPAETALNKKERCVVIAPPSALGSAWLRKFKSYKTAIASGWMALRGARRRRAVDKGFVLSDHLDWNDLHTVLIETQANYITCTHGYKDIFSQYLQNKGYNATSEETEFEPEAAES